jgi:hypothetical protein
MSVYVNEKETKLDLLDVEGLVSLPKKNQRATHWMFAFYAESYKSSKKYMEGISSRIKEIPHIKHFIFQIEQISPSTNQYVIVTMSMVDSKHSPLRYIEKNFPHPIVRIVNDKDKCREFCSKEQFRVVGPVFYGFDDNESAKFKYQNKYTDQSDDIKNDEFIVKNGVKKGIAKLLIDEKIKAEKHKRKRMAEDIPKHEDDLESTDDPVERQEYYDLIVSKLTELGREDEIVPLTDYSTPKERKAHFRKIMLEALMESKRKSNEEEEKRIKETEKRTGIKRHPSVFYANPAADKPDPTNPHDPSYVLPLRTRAEINKSLYRMEQTIYKSKAEYNRKELEFRKEMKKDLEDIQDVREAMREWRKSHSYDGPSDIESEDEEIKTEVPHPTSPSITVNGNECSNQEVHIHNSRPSTGQPVKDTSKELASLENTFAKKLMDVKINLSNKHIDIQLDFDGKLSDIEYELEESTKRIESKLDLIISLIKGEVPGRKVRFEELEEETIKESDNEEEY